MKLKREKKFPTDPHVHCTHIGHGGWCNMIDLVQQKNTHAAKCMMYWDVEERLWFFCSFSKKRMVSLNSKGNGVSPLALCKFLAFDYCQLIHLFGTYSQMWTNFHNKNISNLADLSYFISQRQPAIILIHQTHTILLLNDLFSMSMWGIANIFNISIFCEFWHFFYAERALAIDVSRFAEYA